MKPNELKEFLKVVLQKDPTKVILLQGPVGIGKTEITEQVANELGWEMREVILSLMDPTDLKGIPFADMNAKVAKWLRAEYLPPEDYDKPLIIFFDELNNCFTPDTYVSGKEIKKIADYKEGDYVLDQNGNFQRVYEVKERDYDGDIYKIKATNLLPIKATGEHPLLVVKYHRRENRKHNVKEYYPCPEWIKAKDLKVGYYIGVPILKETEGINNIDFSNNLYGRKSLSIPKNIKSEMKLTHELAEFIGYYVAEGWYGNSKIGLSFGKHELNTYVKRTKDIIENLFGLKCRIELIGRGAQVITNSTILGEWLQKVCGHDAKHKKIPRFILHNSDKSILLAFLKSYLEGDGCTHIDKDGKGATISFATVSDVLARQLQLAFTRFNILVGLSIRGEEQQTAVFFEKGKKRIIMGGKCYSISSRCDKISELFGIKTNKARRVEHFFEKGGVLWVKIKNIKIERYKGKVYNLEVEGTHTYLAENCIVHNCTATMQNACMNMLLRRNLNGYKLPPQTRIIAAGNMLSDDCYTYRLSPALRTRLINIDVEICFDDWKSWAYKNNINPLIIGFHNYRNADLLYNYKSGMNIDKPFSCPRTWKYVSDFMGMKGLSEGVMYDTFKGTIGEAAAIEFHGYCKIYGSLPNPEDILLKGKDIIPKDSSVMYALVSALINCVKNHKDKLSRLVEYAMKIQPEFSVVLVKDLLRTEMRDEVMRTNAFNVWLKQNADIVE